ncbi:MAG: hypothetical protein JWQ43_1714 [Glaciihabitans sp.]|nr:hypothetical protein [Glaciihabitans sp.]
MATTRLPLTRLALVLAVVCALLAGCTAGTSGEQPSPSSSQLPAEPEFSGELGATAESCDGAPSVSTADELAAAVAAAQPGGIIALADGIYPGSLVLQAVGAAEAPITLCGSRDAVLDGGPTDNGYALHLQGASYWNLVGFTVTGGKKTVMLDAASNNTLSGLAISGSGDEGLHLRSASSGNLVQGNEISQTGLVNAEYGEGIYVGTAQSNWCRYTGCEPDRSDGNRIIGNTIFGTSSENIDVKEGTTGGEISGNSLDGGATKQADSLVDVKGSGWTVTGNTGNNAPQDGIQVHVIAEAPGSDNTFGDNSMVVSGVGVAINIVGDARHAGNIVLCDNTVVKASQIGSAANLSNLACSTS